MPMKAHENILVFYKKLPTYNPQMETGEPYKAKGGADATNFKTEVYGKHNSKRNDNEGFRFPRDVLKFLHSTEGLHPTQKPLPLLEYFIKTYTNEDELVLDNTAGVLSTCLAAKNVNRKFIGIEKDEVYFSKGLKRF